MLNFKPLTLLSDLNSTGKSSVIQALLLLRQSYQQGLLPKIGLALNGDLVRIGTAQDALFEGANKQDSIGFELVWEDGIARTLSLYHVTLNLNISVSSKKEGYGTDEGVTPLLKFQVELFPA